MKIIFLNTMNAHLGPESPFMTSKVQPIPVGYHSVTPYLLIRGAGDAIEFYKKAFGATEVLRLTDPEGKVSHAEIKIGNSHVMIADEHPELDFLGPQSRGGTTASMLVYVEDADAVFKNVIAAGATELRPLCDQFYGDRSGTVTDPWGHIWSIAMRIEDVSKEDIVSRFTELYGD